MAPPTMQNCEVSTDINRIHSTQAHNRSEMMIDLHNALSHARTGDTGPLVYPAGFVYIYSALYYITAHGSNIRLAQYLFIGVYLLQMFLVLRLYTKALKVPPYVLLITTFTSYRIHSIYVLRLFNDPVAMVLLYAALNCYVSARWTWGSLLLSLGVAVKMNVLLFAPAILLLYLTNLGAVRTVLQLSVCAALQLLLGAPFLWTHPVQYVRGSFDLGRVFEHKWTVNYRFLPRDWFEWSGFHVTLLAVHLVLLLAFVRPAYTYMQAYCRLRHVQKRFQLQIDAKNSEHSLSERSTELEPDADSEPLTAEQQKFLQSYERTLLASAAAKRPNDAKLQHTQHQHQIEKYTLNCEKSVQLILLPLFLANFIGVVCARSLHYQFYVWYFHSLPYLVWSTSGYSTSVRFLLLGVIEFAWNTYPSSEVSSLALHAAHVVLLWGVARTMWRSHAVPETKGNCSD